MDSFYNFVTSCGLRVVNFAENWIEIEISDIYGSQDVSTLLLTVHFGEGDDPVPVEDVTVGSLFMLKVFADRRFDTFLDPTRSSYKKCNYRGSRGKRCRNLKCI